MITFHNNLTNQTLDATDFLWAVSGFGQSPEIKYFCHRCWKQGILMDIIHGCSGVSYPYLKKQDFFSLRILHENSLRLPLYF